MKRMRTQALVLALLALLFPYRARHGADHRGAGRRTGWAGDRRNRRHRRHPRRAAFGNGFGGARGRHPQRRAGQPGQRRHEQPAAHRDSGVPLEHQSVAGRGGAAASDQPARHGAGPHAGAGQQQAAAPRRGHPVDLQRRIGRRPGAGHLGHPGHRHRARGSAARRRGGAVRLGRHRWRRQLHLEGREQRRQHRGQVRRLFREHQRGRDGGLRQPRPAPRRLRLRQPQRRIQRAVRHRPQRPASGRGGPWGARRTRGQPGQALGRRRSKRRHQDLRQHGLRSRQRPRLRFRQLHKPRHRDAVLLPPAPGPAPAST